MKSLWGGEVAEEAEEEALEERAEEAEEEALEQPATEPCGVCEWCGSLFEAEEELEELAGDEAAEEALEGPEAEEEALDDAMGGQDEEAPGDSGEEAEEEDDDEMAHENIQEAADLQVFEDAAVADDAEEAVEETVSLPPRKKRRLPSDIPPSWIQDVEQLNLAAVAAEGPQLSQPRTSGAAKIPTHVAPPWPAVHDLPRPLFLDPKFEALWKCIPHIAHHQGEKGGKLQYTVKDAEGRSVKVNFVDKFFGIQSLQHQVPAMKIVKDTASRYIYIQLSASFVAA